MTAAGLALSHSDGAPASEHPRLHVRLHEARRELTSDGYGRRLGERLRVENAPAIVTRVLRKADMAVTEIRCDNPVPGMSSSFQPEDAFLVGLLLRDYPAREFWEDGRRIAVCDLRAGEMCFYDLKRDPVFLLDKPRHTLLFYLPRIECDS